jgi:hypothetical protein
MDWYSTDCSKLRHSTSLKDGRCEYCGRRPKSDAEICVKKEKADKLGFFD